MNDKIWGLSLISVFFFVVTILIIVGTVFCPDKVILLENTQGLSMRNWLLERGIKVEPTDDPKMDEVFKFMFFYDRELKKNSNRDGSYDSGTGAGGRSYYIFTNDKKIPSIK